MDHDSSGTDKHPLLVGPLALVGREAGVDDGMGAGADVVDEEALLDAHLRGGQADTRGLVHGDEHVVGQLDQVLVDLGDVLGGLAQDRVAEHADLERSHDARVPPLRALSPSPGAPHRRRR